MTRSQRKLPPIVSASDRRQAAHVQADKLVAFLRESDLAKALWLDEHQEWQHGIDSNGGITSEKQGRG